MKKRDKKRKKWRKIASESANQASYKEAIIVGLALSIFALLFLPL